MNSDLTKQVDVIIKFCKLSFISFFILSCKNEVEIHVNGLKDYYVKMYFVNDFEQANGIDYSIHKKDGTIFKSRTWFYGTHNTSISKHDFTAGVCDSIIYITFLNPNEVFVMVDLRNNIDYLNYNDRKLISKDSLSKILEKCNQQLKIYK